MVPYSNQSLNQEMWLDPKLSSLDRLNTYNVKAHRLCPYGLIPQIWKGSLWRPCSYPKPFCRLTNRSWIEEIKFQYK